MRSSCDPDIVARPRLFLNHDADYDWLIALEFGVTDDGQTSENWRPVSEPLAYLYDRPERGRCLGFVVKNWSGLDPHDPEVAAIWSGPRFDVPVLGLRGATAGEVILAADWFVGGHSTVNRYFFDLAVETARKPREAVVHWRACLQTGDVMAHYGLGYTLYELGQFHEAYRHLRAYTEITPKNAWAWCWLGKAADAIGETAEAKAAYRRALQLEEECDDETDAGELLEELLARDTS
jgi:tetratricopeptide (TPR) repeat protein